MQLSEIGIAGWTMAIGFLIIGVSPPPEFEASARPGGAIDLPIQFGMEPSNKTVATFAVFENCPDLLAASLTGPETSGFAQHQMEITSTRTDECTDCLGESQSAKTKTRGQDCAIHDLALLTLQF